jgi:hypothetical protein
LENQVGLQNLLGKERASTDEEIRKLKKEMDDSKKKVKEIKGTETKLTIQKKENESIISRYFYPFHLYNPRMSYFNWNIIKKDVEKYYLFDNKLYYINIEKDKYRYNDEQIKLLLKEYVYKENSKFDKLKKQIELFEKLNSMSENTRKRETIPEEVKFEVWRRDEGKCVICGSKENLEFDHIIPFSKGGGNTVRNLQLLCEACNRKKSDKI